MEKPPKNRTTSGRLALAATPEVAPSSSDDEESEDEPEEKVAKHSLTYSKSRDRFYLTNKLSGETFWLNYDGVLDYQVSVLDDGEYITSEATNTKVTISAFIADKIKARKDKHAKKKAKKEAKEAKKSQASSPKNSRTPKHVKAWQI